MVDTVRSPNSHIRFPLVETQHWISSEEELEDGTSPELAVEEDTGPVSASPNTVPLLIPYSAGRSQESGHPLPPSNALMDMFATHRVSINLGKVLL